MATEFYVIMQKRQDGKVYADLHKTNQIIYLEREDAERWLNAGCQYEEHSHVVKLIAHTEEEYDRVTAPMPADLLSIKTAPRDGSFFALYVKGQKQPYVVNWPVDYLPGVWRRDSSNYGGWSGSAIAGTSGSSENLAGWQPVPIWCRGS